MIVSHKSNMEGVKLEGEGIKNVNKKVIISPKEGWEGHVMRIFELEEQGHTPRHSHSWPHINYIIKGKGTLHLDGKDYEVEAGSYAYVPADKIHQFSNRGKETFEFICIVPEEGEK